MTAFPVVLDSGRSWRVLPSHPLNDAEAIRRPHLPEYVVYVIFHRLLGKAEPQRNLLIRQALPQQFYQLLLSPAEPKLRAAGNRRSRRRLLRDRAE